MTQVSRDTICALSSGRLPAGVGLVRVSGPAARRILKEMTGWNGEAGQYRAGPIRKRNGEVIDFGVCLFFEGPHSFTGEDVAEFHFHGGRAVVNAGIAEVCAHDGVRMAVAGEFARQAFVNGKIDLVSAENLADLIDAETETQRRLAIENARGAGAARYRAWRSQLLEARSLIEAELDFADEEDIPGSVINGAFEQIDLLIDELTRHSEGYGRAEIIREGFRVVLLGPPNAGKSTLLNALARRDVAIVSEEPGTTRDILEVSLDLNGLKVIVSDTAGLRDGGGTIERIGMERALERARIADMVLWLDDGGGGSVPKETPDAVVVGTKMDLRGDMLSRCEIPISAVTGEGLDSLIEAISAAAEKATSGPYVLPTHIREAAILQSCVRILRSIDRKSDGLEIVGEKLREAGNDLGRIIGAIGVEDMLDLVFSRFCIGK